MPAPGHQRDWMGSPDPKELAMLKRLKGQDAEESKVGAEDFNNANTTCQLAEEGGTWVCMSGVTLLLFLSLTEHNSYILTNKWVGFAKKKKKLI